MKQQNVDTKTNLPDTGEADECLFEYLHAEMVNYVLSSKTNGKEGEEELSPLEWMGFGVGYRIMERLTREWARFKDELDTIKFICMDLWSSLYRKQIDNLRTNHQGVYVLHDNAFRLLTNIGAPDSTQYLREAPRLLAFTCGLLRGSLANLGIVSTVTAEIATLPSCKFHVQVQRV
ncbi:trafficking protein particle complex subunit 6b [Neodiprion pinetum]|uniref:Trafficking protein particle complex subunit 6b n=1 Tax=Neodiprion lecontei TaxID=441921 RepID=A0A6J0BRA5_NEOLC|nr:trafficking protein particle complex subunit 6b [Neodiprion lecontei]XP_046411195.1 trafficking protein particle complex subunit 6b [Neodiprion fabricii]XP_046466820.1 trafficking protein particle complex subunit 6b [Neodiprion pinetum]XP_046604577.1 trafficking protein particle complex subunit 6b [Neodiprion virginianus]